jgi:hypothetical protein
MIFPKSCLKSVEKNGKKFTVYLVELENAVFGFFFEGENRKIGTMALAIPKTNLTMASSTLIIGHKNVNITRILAEHLASKFRKLAISSVFIYQEDDIHTNKALLELAKSIEIE